MAAPVFSVTRAEIEEFRRRKEAEEGDRCLAAEKEAARTKAKALKVSVLAAGQLYLVLSISISALDFSMVN
jgi:hypothetical protein